MRIGLLIAGTVVAVALASAAVLRDFLATPLQIPAAGYVLSIAPGDSLAAVARRLADDGIVASPRLLTVLGRWSGEAARIRAGEYALKAPLRPKGLLAQLVAGNVILHSVTLVEGRSVAEFLAALRAEPALRHELVATDATALAGELGFLESSAEGLLFPDTYRFPRGTSDRDVLRMARAAMDAKLAKAWEGRAPDLPLTSAYELLVLASIVERESALAAERPLVAGVFARRLSLGMRLQADPTVIYGLGPSFDGNLTRKDLQQDTPFNTYTRTGLPPTPIGNPGGASLEAAARPASGDALYFVATGRGDGSHRFSATLDEHNAAVRDFLAARTDP